MDLSFSSAAPSCITCWGSPASSLLSDSKADSAPTQGVAVGCRDGSVFILRTTGQSGAAPSTQPASNSSESVLSPTSARRFLGLGRPTSRSASPSSTKSSLSPFQVTRSRIVSAVSNEQAEAPKNYVDFDDEQEKLRGMLKGKGHRDRHSSTSRTRPDKDAVPEKATQTPGSSLLKDDTRSYLTSALSPTSSTLSLSLSGPPSPILAPAPSPEPGVPASLSLRCHIFPPQAGPGRAVTSLKLHDGGRYVTCLNAAG